MTYGTPVTSESANYSAIFFSSVSGAYAQIDLNMKPGEGTWTQSALDTLFQDILDALDGSGVLSLEWANKHQGTNTEVTPTP